MHTLSVKCQKHPELEFVLVTGEGINRKSWSELDEKGKADVWYKDAGASETFISKVISHFTQCDGQMIKGPEQFVD